MIISLRDGFKLFGIIVVVFCAVFVSTFMLNFYMDATALQSVPQEAQALYDAQLATAQFSSGISGGFLSVTAAIMLVFYIRLYISGRSRRFGIIKAMGYSDGKIALGFWVFGLCVFIGAVVGFGAGWAFIPYFYSQFTIEGLDIAIRFHPLLAVVLVVVPTLVYGCLACVFAYFSLKKPIISLLSGKTEVKIKNKEKVKDKEKFSFLTAMCIKSVTSKKVLAFFVAFAAFCFSSMVQMGLSMEDLASESMGLIIFIIGLVLAVTSMIMAVTSLVNANVANVTLMKSFGYGTWQCVFSVFGGYIPLAVIGFALGTVYQYGLLKIMVDVVFADVSAMPMHYTFSVKFFFITLAAFVAFYIIVTVYYVYKIVKTPLKQAMAE